MITFARFSSQNESKAERTERHGAKRKKRAEKICKTERNEKWYFARELRFCSEPRNTEENGERTKQNGEKRIEKRHKTEGAPFQNEAKRSNTEGNKKKTCAKRREKRGDMLEGNGASLQNAAKRRETDRKEAQTRTKRDMRIWGWFHAGLYARSHAESRAQAPKPSFGRV